MFQMKNKNKSKRRHGVLEFSQTRRKKPFNNLTIKLDNRESFLVKV